jgi:hypothetical protein
MTTWMLQDLPNTPEEDEAWAMMEKEQQYEQQKYKERKETMYWNNRLVRIVEEKFPDEVFIEVQEVYYNDKDEPCGYCDPCLGGESVEEAKAVYERIAEAFGKPVLDSSKDFNHKFREEDDNEFA